MPSNLNLQGITAPQVETIAGHPFGSFFISVPSEPGLLRNVIGELQASRNTVEHLGYVA